MSSTTASVALTRTTRRREDRERGFGAMEFPLWSCEQHSVCHRRGKFITCFEGVCGSLEARPTRDHWKCFPRMCKSSWDQDITRGPVATRKGDVLMDSLAFLVVPGAPPPPPTAAYSHAVRAGDFLFVTGQLGVDPWSNTLVPGGAVAQTRRVMENLKTVLAGAGTSLDRAVMVRIYLTDFADYPAMNVEYARHFAPGRLPARTTVGVTALALGASVEIDLIVRP